MVRCVLGLNVNVLEMLADGPNNTDEINEKFNKARKVEQFKLSAIGFIFLSLVFVDQALLPFLKQMPK